MTLTVIKAGDSSQGSHATHPSDPFPPAVPTANSSVFETSSLLGLLVAQEGHTHSNAAHQTRYGECVSSDRVLFTNKRTGRGIPVDTSLRSLQELLDGADEPIPPEFTRAANITIHVKVSTSQFFLHNIDFG